MVVKSLENLDKLNSIIREKQLCIYDILSNFEFSTKTDEEQLNEILLHTKIIKRTVKLMESMIGE